MKKFIYFLSFWLLLSSFVFSADIWEVSVDFCNSENNTKSLSMVLDSWKEWEICMEFSNYSDEDVSISYGFVDWSITADSYKSKACKNEWDKELFGQYVSQDVSKITIPSMQKVRQKAYIKFPWWFTGMVNGCLTYFVSNKKEQMNVDSAMFDVLVRKASFIDVLVGWQLNRSLKLADVQTPITYQYNKSNNSLVLSLMFENDGNVNENVLVDWNISSVLGYNLSFSGQKLKVLSDDNAVLKIEIKDIPWYKLFFDVSFDIVSNPYFDFDSNSLPDSIKEPITIKAKTSVFIFPWIFVYVLWGLIVLLVLIKFLKKHLKFQ